MKTLVVAAHNNENTDWVDQVKDYHPLCNRKLRPPGRESNAILWFIVNEYPDLDFTEEIVFCQGNPFDHDPKFLSNLEDPEIKHFGVIHECDHNGAPAYEKANLDGWCDVLGLTPPEGLYRFSAGSQYRVSGIQILRRPLAFYQAMLALTEVNPKAPWVYERLYGLIWNITL